MDRNSFGTDFKFIWHLSPSERATCCVVGRDFLNPHNLLLTVVPWTQKYVFTDFLQNRFDFNHIFYVNTTDEQILHMLPM